MSLTIENPNGNIAPDVMSTLNSLEEFLPKERPAELIIQLNRLKYLDDEKWENPATRKRQIGHIVVEIGKLIPKESKSQRYVEFIRNLQSYISSPVSEKQVEAYNQRPTTKRPTFRY